MRNINKILLSVSFAALVMPTIVYAEEEKADGQPGVDENHSASALTNEIIVTAQKRSQRLQDVPIAIDAFSERAIEARGLNDVEALSRNVPGLTFGEVAGIGLIALRGVGYSVVTGTGENAVAIHRDGIYIAPTGAATLLQEDIGNVEVLRGPQGTLYGRNSTGGVINFISKAPSDDWEGFVSAGYGKYNLMKGKASLGGPISGGLRARLGGAFENRDGWVDNLVTGNRIGGTKKRSVNAAIDADLGANLTGKIRYSYTKDNFAGPVYDPSDDSILASAYPQNTYDRSPTKTYQTIDPASERQIHVISGQFDLTLSSQLALRSITGYVDYRHSYNYDGDGLASNYAILSPRTHDEKDFSQEIVLIGDMPSIDIVMGMYYFDANINKITDSFLPFLSFAGIDRFLNTYDENARSVSVYGDVTQRLTDRFSIYGGLRYLWDKHDIEYSSVRSLVAGGTLTACDVEYNLRDESLTGRAGIQYRFDNSSMAYGQYSVGYKSGGAAAACNNDFEPEKLKSFEIGAKTTPAPGVTLNIAAYHYEYDNQQIAQVVGLDFFVRNTNSRLTGIEGTLAADVTNNFSISASTSFIDSEYKNFQTVDQVFPANGTVDLTGESIVQAPAWAFGLTGEYRIPLANGARMELLGTMNGTAKYKVREFGLGADYQRSYISGDASITYWTEDERYYVRGWVKNIADEHVNGGVVVEPVFLPLQPNLYKPFRANSFSIGRTFGIEVGGTF